MRRAAWLAVLAVLPACARARTGGGGPVLVPLVAVAELRGTTEPCGCNSDPLGDLARLVALGQGGLLLDAGNQLYDATVPDTMKAQADRKADAIGLIWEQAGGEAALGPNDLMGGLPHLRPARQACNVKLAAGIAPPHVRTVAGLRVGVFGVSGAAPRAPADLKVELTPPVEAARRAIATLEQDHAEVIVALLAMPRADARALLQAAPGVDFGVIGVGAVPVEEGMVEPEQVGSAWLVEPADQGRRAARIDVHRGDAPAGARLRPARWDGEPGRALRLSRLDHRKAALQEQLAAFQKDAKADGAFVQARRRELDELVAERARVSGEKLAPPAGAYFTYTLQPIKQALPRDPTVAGILRQLARDNGRANLAAARGTAPPAPEPGKPRYVGGAACARCHKPQAAFWQTTHHAQAWKTLVDVDKQYDYDCVSCHTTGWQEPGGANLGNVESAGLTSVQCEVCHGPGSKHVEEDGLDEPRTIRRAPPHDLCRTRCHTMEHSDTFALEPYLRDIVGPGHGEKLRRTLGDGPTGHALRQRALEAAGR